MNVEVKNRRLLMTAVLLALLVFTTAAAFGQEKVTINWGWCCLGGASDELLAKVIAEFEAENPDINVEVVGAASGQNYYDFVRVNLLAGTGPDIYYGAATLWPEFVQGFFLDLNPYMARDGVELDEYVIGNQLLINGKVYGLPFGANLSATFYNKDLFNQSGLAFPEDDWTWSDMLDMAKKITRLGPEGNITTAGLLIPDPQSGWRNFIHQSGGSFRSEDMRQFTLDTPEAVEALEFLGSLHSEHQVLDPTWGTGTFLEGKAGIYYMNSNWLQLMESRSLPFDWDIIPQPRHRRQASSFNVPVSVIAAHTEHPEEAWRFVRWFTGPEGSAIWSRNGLRVPGILDPGVINDVVSLTDRNIRALFDQLYAGNVFLGPEWGPAWNRIRPMMDPIVAEVIRGERPAPDAAREISERGTEMVQEELALWQ